MQRLFGFQFANQRYRYLSRSNLKGGSVEYRSNALSGARSGTTNSRMRMKEKKNRMELVRGAINFVEMETMGWEVTG